MVLDAGIVPFYTEQIEVERAMLKRQTNVCISQKGVFSLNPLRVEVFSPLCLQLTVGYLAVEL